MRSLIALLIFASSLSAANKYVRQGAAGAGTGLNWTDACTSFTGSCAISSLVRGDTYYVADGTYNNDATWNRATQGTEVITIKKATVADHGTSTGWLDSYGDGQAIFPGAHTITTGYWTFDGQVGDYATSVPYGIIFDFDEGDTAVKWNAPGHNNLVIRYAHFHGIPNAGNYEYSANTKGFEVWDGNNWTLSHVRIEGGESLIQAGGDNYVVEYSYLHRSRSTAAAWHANVFFNCQSTGGTFRYNRIWDYNDEGLFFTGGGCSDLVPTNIKVYGNIFYGTGAETNPRGIELRQDYSYSGIEIYNNTFSNLGVGGILNRAPETGDVCTGCIARNNISYLAGNTLTGLTASNNTDDSTNRFTNASNGDFSLTAALAGESLASEFNADMTGATRGADGTWDRGAIEFGAAPPRPTNYYVSTTGSSSNSGAAASPWNIDCITAKNCTGMPLQPGDIVWFRGGRYVNGSYIGTRYTSTKLTLNYDGSSGNPITFREYPGELPSVDHTELFAGTISEYGITVPNTASWLVVRGFENINTLADRTDGVNGSSLSVNRSGGTEQRGENILMVDIVVKDTGHGHDVWIQSPALGPSDYLFNRCAYIGEQNPDTGLAHCFYAQNAGGLQTVKGFIALQPFSACGQLYGSSDADLKNFHYIGNVCVKPGEIQAGHRAGQSYQGLTIGGGQSYENVQIRDNAIWQPFITSPTSRRSSEFAFQSGGVNLVLEGNVIAASLSAVTSAVIPGLTTNPANPNYFYGPFKSTAQNGAVSGTRSVFRVLPGSPARFLVDGSLPDGGPIRIGYSPNYPTAPFVTTITGGSGSYSGANNSWTATTSGRYNSKRTIAGIAKGATTTLTLTDNQMLAGGVLYCTGSTATGWSALNGFHDITAVATNTVTINLNSSGFPDPDATNGSCRDMAVLTLANGGTPFNCPACGEGTGMSFTYSHLPGAGDTQQSTYPTSGTQIKYTKDSRVYGIANAAVYAWSAGLTSVDLSCDELGFIRGERIAIYDAQNFTGSPVTTATCTLGAEVSVTLPDTGSPVAPMIDDQQDETAWATTCDSSDTNQEETCPRKPTPPTHTPKQFNIFQARLIYDTNVAPSRVRVPPVAGTSSATVEAGFITEGGSYAWRELPSSIVTCTTQINCMASFPQPLGSAAYRIIYNTGEVLPRVGGFKAVAN